MPTPIFKPHRKLLEDIGANPVSNHFTKSKSKELTKNINYCVSQLPALPSFFHQDTTIYNGYTDHNSNYAVCICEEGIFVWPYLSTDSLPLVIEFPFESVSIEGNPVLPIAILTRSSNGNVRDPGIVIIHNSSGLLEFFESVQHSPALGLINNKNHQIKVPINIEKQEFIVFAENVEPAGIIVVSSWKRVILVTLRDFQNKPNVICIEIMKPVNSVLKLFNLGTSSVNTDIVTVRSGNLSNGSQQEIIIQESNGLCHFFQVNLLQPSGPEVDPNSFKHSLNSYMELSIDGFTQYEFEFLDIHRLFHQSDDSFLILCLVTRNHEKNLLFVTAKIDSSGVLVYGSHISNSFKYINHENIKMFIPYLETTVFVVIDNNVILTDLDYSYFSNQGTILYYKPRWEDVVRLEKHVNIIGMGFENNSASTNPAIILLTSNLGVIRVERFPHTNKEYSQYDIIKSHIEQRIFYPDSQVLDFTLTDYDANIVEQSIDEIIGEIVNSKSPYLDEFSVTRSYLEKKVTLLKSFIDDCQKNYHLNESLSLKLVYGLEKVQFGLYFYNELDGEDDFATKSKEILLEILNRKYKTDTDILRHFFIYKLEDINDVFTAYVSRATEIDLASNRLLSLIAQLLYDAVLCNEMTYFKHITVRKSWIFDTDVFFQVEKYFQTRFANYSELTYPIEIRNNIVKLYNVFYYFINQALVYMKIELNNDLESYRLWYQQNKVKWVQNLVWNNLNEEAITLVENYLDFTSLSLILENERDKIIDSHGKLSQEYSSLIARYYGYFEKYGYDFAEALFTFYIDNNNPQILLTTFDRYKSLLHEYFAKNPHKVSNIAWISYLLDNQFITASTILIESARDHSGESVNNQELKYSLAKLGLLTGNVNNKDALFQIESKLILLRIQRSLYRYVIEGLPQGDNEDLKLELLANNFLNPKIEKSTLLGIFKPSFSSFVNNRLLAEETLIDYLTFIRPSSKYYNGFANAFKVASLLPDYKLQMKKIWCRLLVITDNWQELTSTEQRTDEFIKRTIRNSTIYKTMVLLSDQRVYDILQQVLEDTQDVYEDDNILLAELNKSFFTQTVNNIQKYDILSRIRAIKGDIDAD